jgi:xanthine dehydrogenase YagR molybdenum-binding subunit
VRGPGVATGLLAHETAMDELAVALGMDPIALRLKNYAEKDQHKDLPWSSKELRECYRVGAERFGWAQRNPEPWICFSLVESALVAIRPAFRTAPD